MSQSPLGSANDSNNLLEGVVGSVAVAYVLSMINLPLLRKIFVELARPWRPSAGAGRAAVFGLQHGAYLTQDPKDAIENTPVVHGNAARLVREHRFDDTPLMVAELIQHDSRLQFWSLNHVQGDTINTKWTFATD